MSAPHEGQVHHTTLVGAWRSCNFCGASQYASAPEPIAHFESCCIPKGQDAIDEELRIIRNLTDESAEEEG